MPVVAGHEEIGVRLPTVAERFGVCPAMISCIERGARRDDNLADAYRDWLRAA
ncbi:hypothetical protein [Streptomyces sp. R44]|uniref:Uncharacterized protein n=1 Tax=Streptomyces sp. R44 TaxID=3238633 RepID=A0AB39T949_9ACTN